MFRHDEREKREATKEHSNFHIDKSQTFRNYSLIGRTYKERCDMYDEAIQSAISVAASKVETYVPKKGKNAGKTMQRKKSKLRKDAVTGLNLYVPVPIDLPYSEYYRWFKAVHDIEVEFFGAENVIDSDVHYDEIHEYFDTWLKEWVMSRVHMHTTVVPRTADGRLCCNEIFTRENCIKLNNLIEEMTQREFGIAFNTGEEPHRESVERLKSKSYVAEMKLFEELQAKKERLCAEMSEYNEQKEKLITEVSELNASKAIACDEIIRLNAQVSNMQTQVSDMQVQISDNNEKLEKQHTEINECEKQVEKLSAEVAKLNATKDEAEQTAAAALNEVNRLSEQVGNLQTQALKMQLQISDNNETLNEQDEEIIKRKKHIAGLDVQISDRKNELEELVDDIVECQKHLVFLNNKKESDREEIAYLNEIKKRLTNDIDELNKTEEEQINKINDLNKEINEKRMKLQSTTAEVRTQKANEAAKNVNKNYMDERANKAHDILRGL